MRIERKLDELYNRVSPHLGWLSYLLEAKAISPQEEAYLVWRDNCDTETKRRLSLWTEQVELSGGIAMVNAETSEERFSAICDVIIRLEQKVLELPSTIAEAYRQFFSYRKFINMRAILRLKLDPPYSIPEHQIQKAREYRLDDLLANKLKRRFMVCPIHPEKHASFFVTSFGYCFGCQRSWDAISWLQEFEGMSFQQTIEFLSKNR